MYYTYVIQSEKDKRFYTGFTSDLQNRLKEHSSRHITSTRNRGTFKLIYYEACLNEQDATAREKYLKSGMGKRYIKNRLKRFLSLTGLMIPTEPKKKKIGFRRGKE
ncbi:MAG: GIY-YIG nuclease family protein [Thermodesulfovibrionia bacterium]